MRRDHSMRRFTLVAAYASCLLAGIPSAGAADDQVVPKSQRAAQKEQDDELPEIVVTGSRIARPDDERLQPTTILTAEFLDLRGYTNVLDALRELPAFGEPANSLVGFQTSEGVGQSFSNFLSLGSQRTLTLVDGRRFVPSASPSVNGPTAGFGGDQVDLNVVPTQLIDRIETISVGGAPIYGADAIAGTVNIILKHNYDGADVDVEGGISGRGDASQYRVRALLGQNFDSDRGNITFNAEFSSSDGLSANQRSRTADNLMFVPPKGPSPYQYVPASNVRFANYSASGIPLVDDGYLGANPNFAISNSSGQTLAFSNGHLAPYNPGNFVPPGFFAIGGDGYDLANITPLLVSQERINATTLGNFRFNDNARLFAELWYSETHNASPFNLVDFDSAVSGVPAGQPQGNLIIQVNNPFLSPVDQAIIAKNLAAYAAASPVNPQQTNQFYMSRVNQDIGNGASTADQNTKRFVLGIDGTLQMLGNVLNYEISGNYGESRNFSVSPQPNWNNFQNALNAVLGPNGQIICNPYQPNGKPIVNSPAPAESSTCAPFNPFGNGIASPAAIAYVTSLGMETSTLTQRDFNASLNGALFSLPAGPVKAAFGYENRREGAAYQANQFLEQADGYLNYLAPFVPVSGSYLTNEFFGEVLLPVISPAQSRPWAHRLEFEAAAREVDHSIAGKSPTWTAGLRFEPVGALQFRGNYTHSIRAPSVTEAYLPTTSQYVFAYDPCDQSQISSGPNPAVRSANCAKAGIVQPFNSNILYIGAPSTNAGDPHLRNEVADARAVGFAWRPSERAVFSVDYLQIDISQAITTLSATTALDACYDSPGYPNAFCGKFTRDGTGQITFVQTGYANVAFLNYNGVQTQFDWSFDVPFARTPGGFGTLDVRINEFFLNRLNSADGSEAVFVDAGELGLYKHKGVIDLTWRKHQLYALWQANFTGPAVWANAVPANFSAIKGVGAWWLNDLTLGYRLDAHLKLQLTIDNLFDKQAPYPLPVTPYGPDYYSYWSGLLGRYFKATASYRF
jgi:iron complex outermembrane recepter protein